MPTLSSARNLDDGLSLIEIVVAMFMLSALSLALIPVLITGLKQSVTNSTNSTATQVAHQELEVATSKAKCLDLITYATGAGYSMTDTHGILLRATRTVTRTVPTATPAPVPTATPVCAASDTYPQTVAVNITVKRADTGATLSSGSTLVYLASYN